MKTHRLISFIAVLSLLCASPGLLAQDSSHPPEKETLRPRAAEIPQGEFVRNPEEDPDVPVFFKGRVPKLELLRLRSEYFWRLRGGAPGLNVARERSRAIREAGLLNAVAALRAGTEELSSTQWTFIGPAPIPNGQTTNTSVAVSGRVTAIAIHPTDPNKVYAGTAQGGVYRTLDGGTTWTALTESAETLAIGTIAIAPSQTTTIFVGTGEPNFGGDTFFGRGLYRIDNAESATPTLTLITKNSSGTDVLTGRSISKILVHPTDANTIFVSTTSGFSGLSGDVYSTLPPRGVYRSTNALGADPRLDYVSIAGTITNCNVTDMIFEPGNAAPPNPSTLLVGVMSVGIVGCPTGDGGVWKSTDALLATPSFVKTFALTDSISQKLTAANVSGTVTVFLGTDEASGTVRRSTDVGGTFPTTLANATGFCNGQCTYDMTVTVHPSNPAVLFLGGAANSGTAARVLRKSANANAGTPTFADANDTLHADTHATEIAPSDQNIVYTGNDGGIWRSSDSGATWVTKNNSQFSATQFQSIALHSVHENFMIGGTQDNGTNCLGVCGSNADAEAWIRADFGDGGFALIDQSATGTASVNMYHTYYNLTDTLIGYGYVTSAAAASEGNWTFNGTGGAVTCTNGGGFNCAEDVLFYAPMALGPGTPNQLYFGTDRLHRWTSPGAGHSTVSQAPIVTGVPISAIAISKASDNVRMVGLSNGQVWGTRNGSSTLTNVTGAGMPAKYIGRIAIDPTTDTTAYVAFNGYGVTSGQHIWKTTNFSGNPPSGTTWSASGTGIPDVPVNGLAINPCNTSILYAGTDIGVYRSSDAGANWTQYPAGGGTLPKVAVFDMAYQKPAGKLRIATHGRGMWEISDPYGIAPGGLSASASGNTINLSWTAPSGGASGYRIYRSTVSGAGFVKIDTSTTTSYTDATVAHSATYFYRVSAIQCGEGSASSEASATSNVACQSAPTFPGGTTGTPVNTCTVNLSWSTATSSCGPVTYSVYRSTTSGFTPDESTRIALGLTTTSYTDSQNLVRNVNYYYRIGAVDSTNGRETLNTQSAAVQPGGGNCGASGTNPSPVITFTITSKSQSNELRWVAPTLTGSTIIARYNACTDPTLCTYPTSSTSGTAVTGSPFTASAGSATHSSLENGKTYYYSLWVANSLGLISSVTNLSSRPQSVSTGAGGTSWLYSTGTAALSAPGIEGAVYAVGNDRRLHSMNRLSSGGNWPAGFTPLIMNGPSQGRPTVLDLSSLSITIGGASKVAFLGSQDGYVYAINAATGAQLWRSASQLGTMVQASPMFTAGVFANPDLTRNLVIVGTRNSSGTNSLFGLNAADGTTLFQYNPGNIGIISGPVTIDSLNQRVYFASRKLTVGDPSIWCVTYTETSPGVFSTALTWSADLGDIDGSPTSFGSKIYVGTNAGHVYALNNATGAALWTSLANNRFETGDGPVKGFVSPNRLSTQLFFATSNRLWALNDGGTTATQLWSVNTGPNSETISYPSIPVFVSPYLFAGSANGKLYQLTNVTTATPTVQSIVVGTGDAAVGSPTYSLVTGLGYVGTDSGRLYAVTPK